MSKTNLKKKIFKVISENTNNMQQKEIAEKLGISQSAASLLARESEATFSIDKLLDYCVKLGVSVEYNINGAIIKHTTKH